MTLASAMLKAFVQFPLLKGVYQRGICEGCDRCTHLLGSEGGDYDNSLILGSPTSSTERGALEISTQASYLGGDRGGRSSLAEAWGRWTGLPDAVGSPAGTRVNEHHAGGRGAESSLWPRLQTPRHRATRKFQRQRAPWVATSTPRLPFDVVLCMKHPTQICALATMTSTSLMQRRVRTTCMNVMSRLTHNSMQTSKSTTTTSISFLPSLKSYLLERGRGSNLSLIF